MQNLWIISVYVQAAIDATSAGFVCVYLSRSDGPSVQQGQQTAEGCGSDGGRSTACVPHKVRKQQVVQELR